MKMFETCQVMSNRKLIFLAPHLLQMKAFRQNPVFHPLHSLLSTTAAAQTPCLQDVFFGRMPLHLASRLRWVHINLSASERIQ
jgi:hypothetical protein